MEISTVADHLNKNALTVSQYLFPNGHHEGSRYRVGGVDGEKGRSLNIDTVKGVFCDFANPDHNGDMLDLWCLVRGLDKKRAAQDAAAWAGLSERPQPSAPKERCAANSNPYVLAYLASRSISEPTVQAFRLGAEGKTILFPRGFGEGNSTIKYWPIGNKAGIRQTTGAVATCFGWNVCKGRNRLIITEGEIDAMSVYEAMGGECDVVSVPSGVSNMQWLEHDSDRLSHYGEYLIWMDNDEPGFEAQQKIVDALGMTRCKVVQSKLKDANATLQQHGKQGVQAELLDARSIVRMAAFQLEPSALSGPDMFMEGAIEVFPEIYWHPATTTLLAGFNGTGKSTMSLQMAHVLARHGIKSFIMSPEMPPLQTAQILTRQASDIAQPTDDWWRKSAEYVRDNFLISTVEERLTPEMVIADFDVAYELGCRGFILDSLTCVKSGFELHNQADFADILRNWSRCHPDAYLLALGHMRKPQAGVGSRTSRYDIRGAGEISDLAGHVWLLERKDNFDSKSATEYGTFDARLKVDKNRATGRLKIKPLCFFPRLRLFNINGIPPCFITKLPEGVRSLHS